MDPSEPAPSTRLLEGVANEVRHKTLTLFAAATDAELLWAPPGLSNHILWHAGHALWLQDVLCIEPATGRSELPDGWADTFGQHGRSPSETRQWPTRGQVDERLRSQWVRLQEVLGGLTQATLEAPPARGGAGPQRRGAGFPRGGAGFQPVGPPLWHLIVHGLHDEANHQGEMYLLLKMQRRQ